MEFEEGQGLFGKIQFTDGTMPEYDRPYLIINVTDTYIEVLNVSSIRGKEHKLAYSHNEELYQYDPPFRYPSFVKLDSLVQLRINECNNLRVLAGGRKLDENELDRIKNILETM